MLKLGRVGVWTWAFDGAPWREVAAAVTEYEDLGYGTVWFGEGTGRDAPTQAALLLGATRRITVATGVANIYRHEPRTLAQAHRTLSEAFPGRFLLGLGLGSKQLAEAAGHTWGSPVDTMRDYLAAMDAAKLSGPAPADAPQRILAALGPKMLGLAGTAAIGAHPYYLPVEHTRYARELLGPDAVLAVHQMAVLDPDVPAAREQARLRVADWLAHSHLVPSRRRLVLEFGGLTEADLRDGGSDKLLDVLYAAGDAQRVADRVRAQFAAGADHVCVELVGVRPALARTQYAQLAAALN